MIVSALPVQSSYHDQSVVVDPRTVAQQDTDNDDAKPNQRWKSRFVALAIAAVAAVALTAFLVYFVTDSSKDLSAGSSSLTPSGESNTIGFETTQELYGAVDYYLAGDIVPTLRYGSTIDTWDVSKIQIFDRVFSSDRNGACAFFDADLTSWDTSSAVSMIRMFSGAMQFNGDISSWDVRNVRDMTYMFNYTRSFEGDLSNWAVGNVETMEGMFHKAINFRGNLSQWDVGSVENMEAMFYDNRVFNQDISGWDVRRLRTTSRMFCKAYNFNQDLSGWNVQSLVNLKYMFEDASRFNQNLCAWGSILPSQPIQFEQTFALTSCPNMTDPLLPVGPFCYECEA